MKLFSSLVILSGIAMMSSCVTARKYDELAAKKTQCETDNEALRKKSEQLQATVKEQESQLGVQGTQLTELQADTADMGKQYRQLRTQYDKINELNDILSNKSNMLLDQASSENKKLMAELDATRVSLQHKEDALKALEKTLDEKQSTLNSLQTDLQQREQRVNELEQLMAQQEAASNALKNKITAALLGFKDKGLTVEQRDGKVYVKMEAKLLFASGSTKVEDQGKQALIDLAKAIENEADMEIVVEGHTDTDKISSSTIPRDNWELSVLRATEVVKIMAANSKLQPKVLSASGRSEYHPVDPADKAKNRRIEIILSPKLDELYQIIGN
ncbi:MAG: OmpA family protein [Flavobacteriales bacterium]|nr:OmpA family protein [Flavobacteriales bacterium]